MIGRTNSVSGGKYMRPIILTETGTWTVPHTGKYRVAAVGRGANGTATQYTQTDGCCGGAGYVEINLAKDDEIPITIDSSTSFGDYITATAGSTRRSGTVSGDGVIAFESNNKESQQSIIAPDIYADLISSGGYTSGNDVPNGGNGVFGGIGGTGGVGRYSNGGYFSSGGTVGGVGAGAGGNGYAGTDYMGTTTYSSGGGGGGGFGGGGRRGFIRLTSSSAFQVLGYGYGGAGGIYIEKIS